MGRGAPVQEWGLHKALETDTGVCFGVRTYCQGLGFSAGRSKLNSGRPVAGCGLAKLGSGYPATAGSVEA